MLYSFFNLPVFRLESWDCTPWGSVYNAAGTPVRILIVDLNCVCLVEFKPTFIKQRSKTFGGH